MCTYILFTHLHQNVFNLISALCHLSHRHLFTRPDAAGSHAQCAWQFNCPHIELYPLGEVAQRVVGRSARRRSAGWSSSIRWSISLQWHKVVLRIECLSSWSVECIIGMRNGHPIYLHFRARNKDEHSQKNVIPIRIITMT